MPAEIVAVVVVVAIVVVSVPVRRLILDGRSRWTIVSYVALLCVLAAGVTEARTLGRFLLPMLGLAYLAPFITLGPGIDRLLGRRPPVVRVSPVPTRAIAPPRDVTPAPRDVRPSDGTTAGQPAPGQAAAGQAAPGQAAPGEAASDGPPDGSRRAA